MVFSQRSSRRLRIPPMIAARALGLLLAASALAACTPRMIPIPVTQAPTPIPATPTLNSIGAPVVDQAGLLSLRMFDEDNGWGISDKLILRTADGGATWHDVGPKPATTYGYAVSSDFLDPQHGWILVPDPDNMLSGILYRTVDGGLNWDEAPVPFGGGALQFLDARHGWMMASLGAGAGSMGVSVFQTDDGGASWSQRYTNDPNQAGASASLPLNGLKDGLTPLSAEVAWIGGVIYTPGTLYLYQTADGGQTWSPSPAAVPKGYEQAELETTGPIFIDAKTAFLPVHVSSQNGVMLAIYVSQDGGTSWLLSPSFVPLGGATDFVSPTAGVVWNGTVFYRTKDAALTWETVTPDVAFGDSFAGMDFVSPQVGFVLTDDGSIRHLYKTADGGASWTILGY